MAKKRNDKRKRVTLKCATCGRDTYRISKNVQNTPEKLALNKYCKFCKTTTVNKEKK
ncbi:MAG: 50S ribosomal protein L33 [Bacilli bacterium]